MPGGLYLLLLLPVLDGLGVNQLLELLLLSNQEVVLVSSSLCWDSVVTCSYQVVVPGTSNS